MAWFWPASPRPPTESTAPGLNAGTPPATFRWAASGQGQWFGSCNDWPLSRGSVPGTDDLAAGAGIHQVEALLEVVDMDLVGQHLLQREAGQHHLGHLVPGLVHAPAVDALQGESLEDHPIPVDAGALGLDAEQGDLAAVVHAVEHVVERARVAAHLQAHVEALHVEILHHVLE